MKMKLLMIGILLCFFISLCKVRLNINSLFNQYELQKAINATKSEIDNKKMQVYYEYVDEKKKESKLVTYIIYDENTRYEITKNEATNRIYISKIESKVPHIVAMVQVHEMDFPSVNMIHRIEGHIIDKDTVMIEDISSFNQVNLHTLKNDHVFFLEKFMQEGNKNINFNRKKRCSNTIISIKLNNSKKEFSFDMECKSYRFFITIDKKGKISKVTEQKTIVKDKEIIESKDIRYYTESNKRSEWVEMIEQFFKDKRIDDCINIDLSST